MPNYSLNFNNPDTITDIVTAIVGGNNGLTFDMILSTIEDSYKIAYTTNNNRYIDLYEIILDDVEWYSSNVMFNYKHVLYFNEPITVIPSWCFFHDNLTSVSIPTSVNCIRENAFNGCENLNELTYNGTMSEWNSIELQNGWNNSSVIDHIVCTDGIINLDEPVAGNVIEYTVNDGNVITIDTSAIQVLPTIVSHNINDNNGRIIFEADLTELPELMFCDNSNLVSIVLPETINSIGDGCFVECSELRSIILPAGVSVIPNDCFAGCTALNDVTCFANEIMDMAFDGCTALSEFTTTINGSFHTHTTSFNDCISLRKFSILGDVNYCWFESRSFVNCDYLSYIYTDMNGNGIEESVFENNWYYDSNIESIIFNNDIEYPVVCDISYRTTDGQPLPVPQHASMIASEDPTMFTIRYKCYKTTLNEGEFSNLETLQRIDLPNNIKIIPTHCFNNCKNLEIVNLPLFCENISNEAFNNCFKLNNILLPNTINTMSTKAFNNCLSLDSVRFFGNLEEWENINSQEQDESYKLPFVNTPLTTVEIRGYDMIGAQSIVSIPNRIMYKATGMTNIQTTSSIYPVMTGHTYNNTNQTGVIMFDTTDISNVSASCFSYSTTNEVCIPATVTTLGFCAFLGTNMTEFVINRGIQTIEHDCFTNSSNLDTIYYCGTIAELNNINFVEHCFDNIQATRIICTDGYVNISDLTFTQQ